MSHIINNVEYVKSNGHLYRKDCPKCHGTGCIYTIVFDSPEQCDCGEIEPPDDSEETMRTT